MAHLKYFYAKHENNDYTIDCKFGKSFNQLLGKRSLTGKTTIFAVLKYLVEIMIGNKFVDRISSTKDLLFKKFNNFKFRFCLSLDNEFIYELELDHENSLINREKLFSIKDKKLTLIFESTEKLPYTYLSEIRPYYTNEGMEDQNIKNIIEEINLFFRENCIFASDIFEGAFLTPYDKFNHSKNFDKINKFYKKNYLHAEKLENKIILDKGIEFNTVIVHEVGNVSYPLVLHNSLYTQLRVLCYIFEALDKKGIIVIDDIDRIFDDKVCKKILKLFSVKKHTKAQLIFTTRHEIY
jgi:hypothetical protein